jgi:hypothetical protein
LVLPIRKRAYQGSFFDREEKNPKIFSDNVNAIKPHMVPTTKMEAYATSIAIRPTWALG